MSQIEEKDIIPIDIKDELKGSYLDYAMSVIIGRALPDVHDGLKPVHRRILYAMSLLKNDWNKPYKKSARIVGDVIGKYHPHGDSAVYDAIVRMAQDFSLRYPLVDGQGNFGSIDGDSAAAMRYTEIRMNKIAHQLLSDLEKDTVDFVDNYDGSEKMPTVLPAKIPNLLINGSSGIAVGMATNIPPHNLNEVIQGTIALIENPNLTIEELINYIPGPDFPTKAQINGKDGIKQAYLTGKGKIHIKAKAEVVEENEKEKIIIHEIPYQVNKARLIEKIAEHVKNKKIEGISEIRDESDSEGIRVVLDIKRNESGKVILNQLYALTQLQVSFGINLVALQDGQPKLFNLKEILSAFIKHRKEVITRRTIFDLNKAKEKAHILEGLTIAIANIDEIINLIKQSPTPAIALENLMGKSWNSDAISPILDKIQEMPERIWQNKQISNDGYKLSKKQAQSILELRLNKLTNLEHNKIIDEFVQIIELIKEYLHILSSNEKLMSIIKEELEENLQLFGDKRQTIITNQQSSFDKQDLITKENIVITLSNLGYIKYQPLDTYQSQRRGGKGKSATNIKDSDFITKLITGHTHQQLLCFSSKGKLYWLKAYDLPEASRNARGKTINNLLPLEQDENITNILPVENAKTDAFIVMATKNGIVKKTALEAYMRPRAGGIIAININDNDALIGVSIANANQDIMLFSKQGKVVRFNQDNVRAVGRNAIGVKGISLADNDSVISLIIPESDNDILTATSNGFGKRTPLSEYVIKGRATKGVISIKTNERNGEVIGALPISPEQDFMLISNQGTLVRTPANQVGVVGRNTAGVKLINLNKQEQLVQLQVINEIEDNENNSENGDNNQSNV